MCKVHKPGWYFDAGLYVKDQEGEGGVWCGVGGSGCGRLILIYIAKPYTTHLQTPITRIQDAATSV